ncbi:hypothetical protein D3C86_1873990 [compost metagenome]
MTWQGGSEFYPSHKSNDWFIPNDPEEVSLNIEGSLNLVKLTKYSSLIYEHIDVIVEDIKENSFVREFLANVLENFKHDYIQSYEFDYDVFFNDNTIKIIAKAYQFEIQE